MFHPKRKATRIPNYNYASCNYYFVTICTHEKKCIFGQPGQLNPIGRIAEDCLQTISNFYPQAVVEKCVIMPNHVHAIIVIGKESTMQDLPSLTKIIGQYKMSVTKKVRELFPDKQVWQRSFHDHVIRDRRGYQMIWEYIESNPLKWEEDCFYCSEQNG